MEESAQSNEMEEISAAGKDVEQKSIAAKEDADRDTFTTTEFIDKIKETLQLAAEIQRHPQTNRNEKIRNLIKLQSQNTLQLLTTLNGGGGKDRNQSNRSNNFHHHNLSDAERMSLLTDINDSLVDKTIHYMERVRNINEGKQDLIEVHAKLQQNFSRIELRDFNKSPNQQKLSGKLSAATLKRKHDNSHDDNSQSTTKRITFLASSNIARPQTVYRMKIDNSISAPFRPKLTRKPNAIIDLAESISPIKYEDSIISDRSSSASNDGVDLPPHRMPPSHYYPHPYQREIESFECSAEFLDEMDSSTDDEELESPPPPLPTTPAQMVQNGEELSEMISELRKFPIIAVDVEHHSFRTYQGITCLLQISTEQKDYIVDVFPLWRQIEALNEVFTSPHILKIFHGADYDIIWLQRDLGLYVVNMFDTAIAAKMLNYTHISLSHLVSRFVDYQMDKRYQLADWRIRPLPEEMLAYARLDTRFLIHIYRRLKRELLRNGDTSANLLRVVMDKSRDLCLKRYEKRLLDANDHFTLIWKHNLRFDARQRAALQQLYGWRDSLAREQDESTGYVLPNNLLIKICEILPREPQGILACCNPIPPLVRQNINEIHKILLDARSVTLNRDADGFATGPSGGNNSGSGTVSGTPGLSSSKSAFALANRRAESSIDLSQDRLIDDDHLAIGGGVRKLKVCDHADDTQHRDETIVPLFTWSSKESKFEPTRHVAIVEMRENGKFETVKSNSQTNCVRTSLSEMFAKVDADDARVAKIHRQLFADYVSPYQRYKKSIIK